MTKRYDVCIIMFYVNKIQHINSSLKEKRSLLTWLQKEDSRSFLIGKNAKAASFAFLSARKKIIHLDESVNAKGYHPAGITDMEECIGCQSCATMCPDCCISIYELEEGEA